MLFSLQWLCQLGGFEQDADRVAQALTARGLTVDSIDRESVPGDVVLDIDVPANRPDCLGHLGVAREAAAAFGTSLSAPPDPPPPGGGATEQSVRVDIEAPDLCKRYTAQIVRDVRIGPSPEWVVRRLEACGLRSISNVVDASNLVLLEVGQPIHTFDLDRVMERADGATATVVVRRGRDGERFVTLDGIERTLGPEDIVIADRSVPIALGGVMGGKDTEIRDDTTNVLIEAAWFHPIHVRRTSRRLGLMTDAGHRFERGVDPEAPLRAQALAARLLHDLAGGTMAPGPVDACPAPPHRSTLTVRPSRVDLLLGYEPGIPAMMEALRALALAPEPDGEDLVRVAVPTWRVDLEREVDVIEEIARHLGYDRIPCHTSTAIDRRVIGTVHPLEERTRNLLASLGFLEAFNYAMLAAGEDDGFTPQTAPPALALDNPIAQQMSHLRRSLLPGLVRSIDLNLRRGSKDVRLYEVGKVFLARDGRETLPREPLRAGIAWIGAPQPRHWSRTENELGLSDAAGVVEGVLRALLPRASLIRQPGRRPDLHPGKTVVWTGADGVELACCGALHPEARSKLELAQELYLGEIDLDDVLAEPDPGFRLAGIPKVPAVTRDLSFTLPTSMPFRSVEDILRGIEAPAPVTFEVIDRYEGRQVRSGACSVTVRVMLQPLERTLTDEATEAYRRALVAALEGSEGIKLRG